MPPRRLLFWAILIASAFFAWSLAFGRDDYSEQPEAPASFHRADVDGDGQLCAADAFTLVYYLVRPGADHLVQCEDAADANDDRHLRLYSHPDVYISRR